MQIQFSGAVSNPPLAAASNAANVPFALGAAVPLALAQFPSVAAVNPALRSPWTEKFNAAFERRLGDASSVMVAYVGSRGHDLYTLTQPNGGAGVPQAQRPDPRFSRVAYVDNLAESRYHSLQLQGTLKRRYLDITAAYTLANAKDHSTNDLRSLDTIANLGGSPAAGFQGGGNQWAPIARDFDWGPADYDVRHTLTVTHVLDLPFGSGRKFLSSSSGMVNALAGGWSIAGFAFFRTGEPINITLGADANDDGDTTNDRPVLLSGSLNDLYAHGRTLYLITQAEALRVLGPAQRPDPTLWVGRNALRAPRVQFVDFSAIKRVTVNPRVALSFELNVFNLFNRVNLAAPIANLGDTRFGQIVATRAGTNPRQIQLGLRTTF
jgi:hypothetical protein